MAEAHAEDARTPGWCALCRSRCGCISVVRGGRLVGIERDPSHPTGRALCAKGQAAPDQVESPDRILHPMKRTRPKGDPDPGWVRISWDEALDAVAGEMRRIAAESGPESVAFAITTPSGTAMSDSIQWVERLMHTFGSRQLLRHRDLQLAQGRCHGHIPMERESARRTGSTPGARCCGDTTRARPGSRRPGRWRMRTPEARSSSSSIRAGPAPRTRRISGCVSARAPTARSPSGSRASCSRKAGTTMTSCAI